MILYFSFNIYSYYCVSYIFSISLFLKFFKQLKGRFFIKNIEHFIYFKTIDNFIKSIIYYHIYKVILSLDYSKQSACLFYKLVLKVDILISKYNFDYLIYIL